ncbi:MAG: binding-protein-dependent transport system inner rane component, partial [Acidimicrobiales bacterium]|nr:binding-protein-dependent transport system inner rane component [Acidimicrobiales bacterium]
MTAVQPRVAVASQRSASPSNLAPGRVLAPDELRASESSDAVDLETLRTGTGGRRSRWRLPRGLERFLGVVVLFAFWEVASRAGWVSKRHLAAPSTVLTAAWDLLRDGTLTTALWASLQRVLKGLAFGIPIGAGLALIAGLWRVGDDLVDANVQMLRFVPIIA